MTTTQVSQHDIGHMADVPRSLDDDAGSYDTSANRTFRHFDRRSGIAPSNDTGVTAESRARRGR